MSPTHAAARRLAALVLLAIFAAALPASLAAERPFTVSFVPSRIQWNPHYAYTTTEAQVFNALHEGLVSSHPATLRPVPGAAESWSVSEDGLAWTFRLREGLAWSNGESITSGDFKDSWLVLLSPETGSDYASLLDDIVGARAFRTGAGSPGDVGLETPDDRTLVVILESPSPQFLSVLCHYSFAPLHRDFRRMPDWSALRSIPVSGPYVLRSRNPEEVVLEKNPEYWDADSVALESLRLLFVDDPEGTTDAFNRRRIDWVVAGMDTSQVAWPGSLSISPLFSTTYFYFSNADAPWDDPRVRRALALLVPWEEIRDGLMFPGDTLVPPIPNYPMADAGFGNPGDRAAEAAGLLAEAGYGKGRALDPLVVRVPAEDEIVRGIAGAWERALGIDVSVEVVPFPDYYGSLRRGGYDLATLTWTGDYADPLTVLGMLETASSFNDAGFSDGEFDAILAEAATLPYLQRLVKLREAEEILLRTGQVLPIDHFPSVNLIDLRFLEGWYPNALDYHPFKSIVPIVGFEIPGVAMGSRVRDSRGG